MVDNDTDAGRQAVENVKRALEAQRLENSILGPGTAGYTTSGAAYRGQEIASSIGSPPPADPGFTQDNGLGYVDDEGTPTAGYARAQERSTPSGYRPDQGSGQ